jgi:molybdate transport system regulatory protein
VEIKTKLYLVDSDGEKFMGIGVLWLLKGIEEQGSLRAAAMKLQISYSKAYKMVGNLEKYLGMAVVERHKGGSSHEGASLTEFGVRFMNLYDEFQQTAKAKLLEPFAQFSAQLDQLLNECHKEPKLWKNQSM